jgi:hypothetical protein
VREVTAGNRYAVDNSRQTATGADQRQADIMHKFDFDEWAQLYQRDPAAFEARRKAVLALEIAKAGPALSAQAKVVLRKLEEQVEGKNDAERIQTSMVWMAASMRQLAGRMQDLSEATSELERTVSR